MRTLDRIRRNRSYRKQCQQTSRFRVTTGWNSTENLKSIQINNGMPHSSIREFHSLALPKAASNNNQYHRIGVCSGRRGIHPHRIYQRVNLRNCTRLPIDSLCVRGQSIYYYLVTILVSSWKAETSCSKIFEGKRTSLGQNSSYITGYLTKSTSGYID